MERLHRHLRPLVVAVATLALSAGVVHAGGGLTMPEAAADGLAKASAAAGKTVPVVARPAAPRVEEQPAEPAEPTEPADEQTAEEETAAEPCPMLPAGEEYETHGAKVCAAAHADVPDIYANRGEYVSTVARDNHGAEVKAEKAANDGVPEVAKQAKQKAKEKAQAAGAPADAGPPAGKGGRP
jgi:type IV secretory pathway VirB10-like protein